MAGVLFLCVITNCIFFSFIFWILTFTAKAFYSNNYFNYKLNFYECGFKNITKINPEFKFNYILLVLFLLIYDGEFLILLPYALNGPVVSVEIFCVIFFFFFWLILALFFDYSYHALDWQINV